MPKIWISEIEFSDGSNIQFGENDITIFVGPNNAGKSASLKESANLLRFKSQKGKVIKDLKIEKEGSENDFFSFLETISIKETASNPEPSFLGFGYNVYSPNAKIHWDSYQNGLQEIFSVFVDVLSTEERLYTANPAVNIQLTREPVNHPIHYLQRDSSIEFTFSEYFRRAFGLDLIVHRNAGNQVPLYVGEKPIPPDGKDRADIEYLRELEKLDLLQEQGDGMRSFVGVILKAFISYHSILFIDEPEAFLHPPQARLLGKMLAKDLPPGKQLFLATHSEDFLKGMIDAGNKNLKIIRVQRKGNVNKISVLSSTDIDEIWNDSLLRHSNVLSGLFHSKVIICESDSDSRFYSAILSAIYDATDSVSPDVLFIHCGGKHRIPTVVKSLAKLDVPISVIADFDVINSENPLKTIFEELGGSWSDVETDWMIVKRSIDIQRPELQTDELKAEIEAIFRSTTANVFPKNKISEIEKTLRKASAWSKAKTIGKSFIPSGHETQAFERIQLKFKEKGLFILEIGEVESFVKSVGNHGPKWVNEVLTNKNLKTDIELQTAKRFINEVIR